MTPGSKVSDVEAREREAFEEVLCADRSEADLRRREDRPNEYRNIYLQFAWEGWLARSNQQPSAQWIDCSGRPPEVDQQVWVWLRFQNGSEDQGYAIWTGADWFLDLSESGTLLARKAALRQGLDAADVTHWMPLPQSPDTMRKGP